MLQPAISMTWPAIGDHKRVTRRLTVVFYLVGALALLSTGHAWALGPYATDKEQMVELDCLVKAEMYVELSSPVDSVIEEILVNIGDTVERGQPLATLESSVEKARLKLAQLNAKSVSEVRHREEQLRYAKRYLKRIDELLVKSSVSHYEKDKAATEVALALIELNKANEKWRIAQVNLELAQSQLALRTIKSPIDGIVVDRYAMVGESIRDRSIMKLAKVNPLKVELIAPTEYFGLIRKGMQVQISPEKPANEIFVATVNVVDRIIDPASGSFTVSMLLPNPDERLVGGVNCLASFNFETAEPTNQSAFSLALSLNLNSVH